MNSKTLISTIALTGAALATSSATAAITVASSLSLWTSGLDNTWPNSWVIPSSAPNGGYDWTGQVTSTTTSGTIGDDGFYYAGISFSGTGITSVSSGNALTITATTGAPVTVTFTFDPSNRVKAAGFLVGLGTTPPTSITMFVNGAALSPNVMVMNNNPGVGSNIGFFGAMADGTGTPDEQRISTLTITINAGQTVILTGAYLQLVPAPGAVALLGVASLVGGRRRR